MVQLGLHFFLGCGIWVCGLNLQNESPWGTLKFESIGKAIAIDLGLWFVYGQ
jgi:hypothetical protein